MAPPKSGKPDGRGHSVPRPTTLRKPRDPITGKLNQPHLIEKRYAELMARDDIEDLDSLAGRAPELTPPRFDEATVQCVAQTRAGERCEQAAVPGHVFCRWHGGGVATAKRAAQERLLQAVGPALDVLMECMANADYPTAAKCAVAILDRAGVGPHQTQHVEVSQVADLEKMSDAQIEQRMLTLLNMVKLKGVTQRAIDVASQTPPTPDPTDPVH